MSEFDRAPVAPSALQPARYFAASYAGEHVAGTEFVIGAMFVAWGVGAGDVILGLLVGNTLAVLSWALICAPIATDTRLTLYAYLEKIAGPGFIKLYSVVNGVLMCVLAGAMITVSASAVRILFGIPPQVDWYPTSPIFVLIALGVGAVVSYAAIKGFGFVARFAEVSAPWMIAMFFVGALAVFPILVAGTPDVGDIAGGGDLMRLAETGIWIDQSTPMGFWHVVAIAWGANLAFHAGFGDMTILRFARRTAYGWFSALGMFIGHFAAWLAAGVMGAGAALILDQALTSLDAGEVAYQALGAVGILAVIIAGWTTSNPTIYRAGLAFQSLNPSWSRERVTLVVGAATTIIACFPFVFTKLLGFLGLMALVLAPVGGVIFAEHYLLRRFGLTRYWRVGTGERVNRPAAIAWAIGVGTASLLGYGAGVHVLFLFVPAWLSAVIAYPLLARAMGARTSETDAVSAMRIAEDARQADERAAFSSGAAGAVTKPARGPLRSGLLAVAALSLIACLGLGLWALGTADLDGFKTWIVYPTVVYFVAATLWAATAERGTAAGA